MLLAELIFAGLVLSLVTGGSIRRLSQHQLRGEGLLLMLLPAQVLWPRLSQWLSLGCGVSLIVWLAMMAALVLVLIANSRRYPILSLAALGIVANILVIALNGAMPVSIRASSEMGVTRVQARATLKRDCLHEELDAATRLAPLADVMTVPGPPWQRSVVSIGDVLLGLGVGVWVFTAARPERAR